jgi:acetylornithine/succinyldiaminopimelate/putrescine aminotransferase
LLAFCLLHSNEATNQRYKEAQDILRKIQTQKTTSKWHAKDVYKEGLLVGIQARKSCRKFFFKSQQDAMLSHKLKQKRITVQIRHEKQT